MNIIKHEFLKNSKNFAWWMFGIAILMLLSMIKFEGINAPGIDVSVMFESFPKIVLIIFGMNNLDITQLDGYAGILFIYLQIAGGLYAIRLGVNSTALEINDKTADFIYTKPLSRIRITLYKQINGFIYIILFIAGTYLFTYLGALFIGENIIHYLSINLMVVSLLLFMLCYFSLGAMIAIIYPELGSLYTNLLLLLTYLISIVADLNNNGVLRNLTPFKYFDIADIVNQQRLNSIYLGVTIIIIIVSIIISNLLINRKNIE